MHKGQALLNLNIIFNIIFNNNIDCLFTSPSPKQASRENNELLQSSTSSRHDRRHVVFGEREPPLTRNGHQTQPSLQTQSAVNFTTLMRLGPHP